MYTFSATLRSGNRRGSWWTTAMPSARAWAGPAITVGSPSTRIVPVSGWWTPARILTRVLLPAPFSPTSAWTSPARRSSDTSVRAWVAANDLDTPDSETFTAVSGAVSAGASTAAVMRPDRAGSA